MKKKKAKFDILSKIKYKDFGYAMQAIDREICRVQYMDKKYIRDQDAWREELTSLKKIFYWMIHNKNLKVVINAEDNLRRRG
jgi:predicted nucleic acid binding AN1-type Zn finger protein